jgi:hypothetical protein
MYCLSSLTDQEIEGEARVRDSSRMFQSIRKDV